MADFENHPDVKEGFPPYDPSKPYFPIFYNDVYRVDLPEGHRFPMDKYRRVRERVQSALDDQQTITEFYTSPLATWQELTLTHASTYVKRFLQGDLTEAENRNIGFPWSTQGVKRALSSTGGTVAAACAVAEVASRAGNYPIWSAHVAGGTHHAFHDYGEGFCVFSDIAVAANVVLQRYPGSIRRILIMDLDVHQGNGNAVLFQKEPKVVTFSMHCQANYFSAKQTSDLDVELPAGCTDETYLTTLRHWLNVIGEKGGNFDLVFFQAGVDVLEDDRLGRMSLSHAGVQKRNKLVYDFCWDRRLPLVITMGGGYPRRDWDPILEAHAGVYIEAYDYLRALP